MRALWVVPIVLLGACPMGEERPRVTYDAVSLRWSQDAFGYKPNVTIDLTAETRTPHVGVHVDVEVMCDQKSSTVQAFFMKMSDLHKGDKLHETTEYLFHTDAFETEPKQCTITLSLVGGATPPATFCANGTKVTPGPCP